MSRDKPIPTRKKTMVPAKTSSVAVKVPAVKVFPVMDVINIHGVVTFMSNAMRCPLDSLGSTFALLAIKPTPAMEKIIAIFVKIMDMLKIPEHTFRILNNDWTHGRILRLETDVVRFLIKRLYSGFAFKAIHHSHYDIAVAGRVLLFH